MKIITETQWQVEGHGSLGRVTKAVFWYESGETGVNLTMGGSSVRLMVDELRDLVQAAQAALDALLTDEGANGE